MPKVDYACNQTEERVFECNVDLTNSRDRKVIFKLIDPDDTNATNRETRVLEVYTKQNNTLIQSIKLKDNGGRKPINTNLAYLPNTGRTPVIKQILQSNTLSERVFYSEENISADRTVIVEFRIERDSTGIDNRRYLKFTNGRLNGEEIDLNAAGGKKPTEGGAKFFNGNGVYVYMDKTEYHLFQKQKFEH